MRMDDPKLRIIIDNKQDVELLEFAAAMASVNMQYRRFINQNDDGRKKRSDCKLYVSRVADGSIIIDLCERAPAVLPGVAPLLVAYSGFLVATFDYLCGKASELPRYRFTKDDFLNIRRMVEVAARAAGNSITLQGIHFAPTIVLAKTYNHVESSAIQNQCDREIKLLEKSGDSLIRENVELRLYQARDSALSKSTQGNLGIIDGISDKPKVLAFANDRLRYDITKAEDNPFNFVFSVDIEIKLREGSLFLDSHKDIKEYEILKLHGPIKAADLLSYGDKDS